MEGLKTYNLNNRIQSLKSRLLMVDELMKNHAQLQIKYENQNESYHLLVKKEEKERKLVSRYIKQVCKLTKENDGLKAERDKSNELLRERTSEADKWKNEYEKVSQCLEMYKEERKILHWGSNCKHDREHLIRLCHDLFQCRNRTEKVANIWNIFCKKYGDELAYYKLPELKIEKPKKKTLKKEERVVDDDSDENDLPVDLTPVHSVESGYGSVIESTGSFTSKSDVKLDQYLDNRDDFNEGSNPEVGWMNEGGDIGAGENNLESTFPQVFTVVADVSNQIGYLPDLKDITLHLGAVDSSVCGLPESNGFNLNYSLDFSQANEILYATEELAGTPFNNIPITPDHLFSPDHTTFETVWESFQTDEINKHGGTNLNEQLRISPTKEIQSEVSDNFQSISIGSPQREEAPEENRVQFEKTDNRDIEDSDIIDVDYLGKKIEETLLNESKSSADMDDEEIAEIFKELKLYKPPVLLSPIRSPRRTKRKLSASPVRVSNSTIERTKVFKPSVFSPVRVPKRTEVLDPNEFSPVCVSKSNSKKSRVEVYEEDEKIKKTPRKNLESLFSPVKDKSREQESNLQLPIDNSKNEIIEKSKESNLEAGKIQERSRKSLSTPVKDKNEDQNLRELDLQLPFSISKENVEMSYKKFESLLSPIKDKSNKLDLQSSVSISKSIDKSKESNSGEGEKIKKKSQTRTESLFSPIKDRNSNKLDLQSPLSISKGVEKSEEWNFRKNEKCRKTSESLLKEQDQCNLDLMSPDNISKENVEKSGEESQNLATPVKDKNEDQNLSELDLQLPFSISKENVEMSYKKFECLLSPIKDKCNKLDLQSSVCISESIDMSKDSNSGEGEKIKKKSQTRTESLFSPIKDRNSSVLDLQSPLSISKDVEKSEEWNFRKNEKCRKTSESSVKEQDQCNLDLMSPDNISKENVEKSGEESQNLATPVKDKSEEEEQSELDSPVKKNVENPGKCDSTKRKKKNKNKKSRKKLKLETDDVVRDKIFTLLNFKKRKVISKKLPNLIKAAVGNETVKSCWEAETFPDAFCNLTERLTLSQFRKRVVRQKPNLTKPPEICATCLAPCKNNCKRKLFITEEYHGRLLRSMTAAKPIPLAPTVTLTDDENDIINMEDSPTVAKSPEEMKTRESNLLDSILTKMKPTTREKPTRGLQEAETSVGNHLDTTLTKTTRQLKAKKAPGNPEVAKASEGNHLDTTLTRATRQLRAKKAPGNPEVAKASEGNLQPTGSLQEEETSGGNHLVTTLTRATRQLRAKKAPGNPEVVKASKGNLLDSILSKMTEQTKEFKCDVPKRFATLMPIFEPEEEKTNFHQSSLVPHLPGDYKGKKENAPVPNLLNDIADIGEFTDLGGNSQNDSSPAKNLRKGKKCNKVVRKNLEEFVKADFQSREELRERAKPYFVALFNIHEEIIAKVIVEMVLENIDEEIKIYEPPNPPMTQTQMKLFVFLVLLHQKSENHKNLKTLILNIIWEKLFPEDFFWPDDSVQMCSRFYTALCKHDNNLPSIWRFFRTAMTEMSQRFPIVIHTVLMVWPDILHDAQLTKCNLQTTTAVQLILHAPRSDGFRNGLQERKLIALKELLVKFYNFTVMDPIFDEYPKYVMNEFLKETEKSEKSMSLIISFRDWDWTKKKILPKLLEIVNAWAERKVSLGVGLKSLKLLRDVSEKIPLNIKDCKVDEVYACLTNVLNSGKMDHKVEEGIVDTLISFKDHVNIQEVLSNWIQKGPITDSLKEKIREAMTVQKKPGKTKLNKNKNPNTNLNKLKRKKKKKKKNKNKGLPNAAY